MSERTFPTDEVTLALLRAACSINDDTGRTHLQDFLDFGSQPIRSTLLNAGEVEAGGVAIYEIEHAPGTEPFSEHGVIAALIDEIERLRADLSRLETEA